MTSNFQQHINGLRALAVIGVVLFHFQMLGINSGFVGVDIFFVISGFLMSKILFERQTESTVSYFFDFWMARIRRITPALIFMSITCLFVFSTILLLPDYKKFLRSNVSANLFLSNHFFLGQSSYFDANANTKPLLHTWSLSLEWQFYLIYPFFIYIIRHLCFSAKLTATSILTLTSLAYCIYLTNTDYKSAYFELMPRTWEFLVGALSYLIGSHNRWRSKVKSFHLSKFFTNFSLFVILISFAIVNPTNFPGWIATLPVFSAGFIVINGEKGIVGTILSSRALQFIGDLSYSLYLWHWPIYVYLAMVVAVDKPVDNADKILGLAASLTAACISYNIIEQPMRKNSKYWSNIKITGLWLLSILTSLSILAIFLRTNEAGFRLPVYLANAEKALNDKNPRQDECFLDGIKAASRHQTPIHCRIGVKSDSVDAILWGDSFADAIQPMVEGALTTHNLSGIASTMSGCLPLHKNAYSESTLQREFNHCDQGINKRTLDFIYQTPSLRYISMSANWSRYDPTVLNHEFVRHVCELKKNNRIPVLIGPVPTPNYDVPRVWGRLELKQQNLVESISYSRETTKSADAMFYAMNQNIESSCGEVLYIMPSETYCDMELCYSVKNGAALYVDAVHLSRTGALFMQNQLETVLHKR